MPRSDKPKSAVGVFLDRACDLKDWICPAQTLHSRAFLSRYQAMAGVRIDVDRRFVEATDGRAVIRVPLPESPENFPISQPRRPDLISTVVIDAARVGNVLIKDVPKKSRYRPELLLARVSAGDNGSVVLSSSSNGTDMKDVSLNVLEGHYPNTDEAYPPAGNPICSFSVSADFLARLAKYCKSHADGAAGWVEIVLYECESSPRFGFFITLTDGRVVSGLSTTARKDA